MQEGLPAPPERPGNTLHVCSTVSWVLPSNACTVPGEAVKLSSWIATSKPHWHPDYRSHPDHHLLRLPRLRGSVQPMACWPDLQPKMSDVSSASITVPCMQHVKAIIAGCLGAEHESGASLAQITENTAAALPCRQCHMTMAHLHVLRL